MSKLRWVVLVSALLALAGSARAQQMAFAFDVSGVSAPAANSNGPSIGGGTYTGFSANFLIRHHVGVAFEMNWRASQDMYYQQFPNASVPYRPMFWDFDAIYAPKLAHRVTAEVVAGIGSEDVHVYGQTTCYYTCTNYTAVNEFMGVFGGGLRFYVKRHLFLRPEARLYLVNNNTSNSNITFSSNIAARYGIALGYAFGEE